MIRSLSPLDLIPLTLRRGSLSNKAKTKDSLGNKETRFSTLGVLLGQWLVSRRRRYTRIWAEGLAVRGLASARSHSTAYDWTIDLLLLDEREEEGCFSLLDTMSTAGQELGAAKMFLRLQAQSPLVNTVKKAGFSHYLTQRLYRFEGDRGRPRDGEVQLSFLARQKQSDDEYRLFQLYQACVPASVRLVEGITFREWQETRNKDAAGQEIELVCEKDAALVGWFRSSVAGNSGQFEIMARPEDDLEQMVEYNLDSLAKCRYLFCLAPEFQLELRQVLEHRGFTEAGKYAVLAKELVTRAQEPCLLPLQA